MNPSQSAPQHAHAYKTRFQIYCAVDNEFDRTQGQAKFAAGIEIGCDDRLMTVANFTLLSWLS